MWMQLLPAIAGIWLMASPVVFDYADPARANDRVVGPIVASLAIIAIWEIARPLRWMNVILGGWLLTAPWMLGHPPDARWNSLATGAIVLGSSLVKGKRAHSYGGGWSSLWKGMARDGRSRSS